MLPRGTNCAAACSTNYAHLSTDNTIYPHNGIFKVDNADRERIDYEWDGRSHGANPAIDDAKWHVGFGSFDNIDRTRSFKVVGS